MPGPRLICVIVNWNGWRNTLACLDSLRLQDYRSLEVIVVDNGSTDDSKQRIRAAHPWTLLLETGQNLGYATGCNVGIREAYSRGADLIWLLNNDTVAPISTASALVRTAVAHPEAGAIGSVLYYLDSPGMVQAWGGGSIRLSTAFTRHFTRPASFAAKNTFFTGASLLLPRRVCEEVGIFYEGFFMYCDDSDLSLRIHRAGLPLVMCTGTAILHREGASSSRRSPLMDRYTTTSTLRLLRRHAPIPALSIFFYLFLRILNRLVRGRFKNLAAVWRGIRDDFADRSRVFNDRL